MHYRFISIGLLNSKENNTMMKKIYLSNTTLTYKTDKKTYNNSDMDHIKFLISATLKYKKITKHTLTVIIIILPVVLHIFSMLKYGNPY